LALKTTYTNGIVVSIMQMSKGRVFQMVGLGYGKMLRLMWTIVYF